MDQLCYTVNIATYCCSLYFFLRLTEAVGLRWCRLATYTGLFTQRCQLPTAAIDSQVEVGLRLDKAGGKDVAKMTKDATWCESSNFNPYHLRCDLKQAFSCVWIMCSWDSLAARQACCGKFHKYYSITATAWIWHASTEIMWSIAPSRGHGHDWMWQLLWGKTEETAGWDETPSIGFRQRQGEVGSCSAWGFRYNAITDYCAEIRCSLCSISITKLKPNRETLYPWKVSF